MQSTKYLYDINPRFLVNIPYQRAIEFKLSAATKLLEKLTVPRYAQWDHERVKAVCDSRKHNQLLLDELR